MKDFTSKKISTANLTTLVKAGVFGILSAESYSLSKIVTFRLSGYITSGNHEYVALVLSAIGLLLVIAYLIGRDFFSDTLKIFKSWRLDVFATFCFGILISISFGGIGLGTYTKIVSILSIQQLLVLIGLPFVVLCSLIFRVIQAWLQNRKKKEDPFFISDVEQKTKKDDLLGFSEEADRFAERVFNQGSSDSMVFGIDAPWGIGKSTFVNLCKEYWENSHQEKAIIYSFSPLRYEDRTNLLEKFVDGLIRVIQKHSFVPEIRPLIYKYSRFIKAKASFSGFGVELLSGTYTIDDAFEDLESALSGFDKKIIVVVDDLDRLNFSAIKDVLFAIKKSFTLPNISYVLCYDTENISALEKDRPDIEKVTEFLEKFVNVKVSLYLDTTVLQNYVSKNLAKALSGNSQADPILVSKAIGALIEIYKSQDYHHYLAFIGDVRKLKRLINTLLLLEIEKADFDNSDFNNQDLLHLLLIYINYPNVFRKIYNTETQGKKGFFSVLMPYEDGYPKDQSNQGHNRASESSYKNSEQYTKYVSSIPDNQAFLLNKIFDVTTRLEKAVIDSVPEEIRHSYACFNGGWTNARNLEEYLNLIVKLSKPQKNTQYRFYLNCKNEIVAGKTVEEVLSKEEFSYSKSESTHEQFWRVVTNSPYEFNSQTGSKLITYLLNNIQHYSLFTNKEIGVGLRDDLDFFLIKLLDTVGWTDESGQHRKNTEENITEIAEWVFGEGRHSGNSVIEILAKEERGLLGLYDLLAFRLFCSADRGGDIFNLQRALSKHGDPAAPTEGSTKNIAVEEMREISQKVFQIFVDQYINKNINVFELADTLSLADFTGKYHDFVKEKIASGEAKDVETGIGALKSRVKSFITYQLGNSLISSGVGCGYYDPTGKEDKNVIKVKINDYLFGECFNPEKDAKNYQHFIDYLLINFASVFASEQGRDYIPHANEFTKALERDRLIEYWKKNGDAIKALNLPAQDKIVHAGNYTATYKKDLPEVYTVLDKLIEDNEKEAEPKI